MFLDDFSDGELVAHPLEAGDHRSVVWSQTGCEFTRLQVNEAERAPAILMNQNSQIRTLWRDFGVDVFRKAGQSRDSGRVGGRFISRMPTASRCRRQRKQQG